MLAARVEQTNGTHLNNIQRYRQSSPSLHPSPYLVPILAALHTAPAQILTAIHIQGIPLSPGRSIAVDKAHSYGTPFFIEAELPLTSPVNRSSFRRIMIAQDTGSAIVGFGTPDQLSLTRTGNVKVYGVASERRVALLPSIPTLGGANSDGSSPAARPVVTAAKVSAKAPKTSRTVGLVRGLVIG